MASEVDLRPSSLPSASAAVSRLEPNQASAAPRRRSGSTVRTVQAGGAWLAALLLLALAALLSGCGAGNFGATAGPVAPVVSGSGTPLHVTGSVHGGQQPVGGSTVQLWQVGTTGYGQGAVPLGASTTTDPNGAFSITGNYSCSNAQGGASAQVYLTASGGNPGLTAGTNNSAIQMLSALGTCGSLTSSTFVSMNEVTTVGSVYALQQFMGANGGIGSYASSARGLVNAFALVPNFIDLHNGVALPVTAAGNGVVPAAKINTLADAIAPCINSPGPGSTQCTALFAAATPAGGAAPANTLSAILNIALNPGANVQQIFGLPDSRAPFQPTVAAVNDWTLTIGYDASAPRPSALAIDSGGQVWVANSGAANSNSTVSLLSPAGVLGANSPYSNNLQIAAPSAIAIDATDNAFVANTGTNSVEELSGAGGSISAVAGPFALGGSAAPIALALDRSGDLFTLNAGSTSVSELKSGSYTAAPVNFASIGLNGPQAIAVDPFGEVFVPNRTGGVVALNPALAPGTPGASQLYASPGAPNPGAIALDASANLLLADSGTGALALLNHSGGLLSPAGGISGAGLGAASSEAVDGRGNVWVADAQASRLSELTAGGAAVSPASGFEDASLSNPASLAIDGSGNVWVVNRAPVSSQGKTLSVSEVIGAAAPVVVPQALALQRGQLALRPGTPQPVAVVVGPLTGSVGSSLAFNGTASSDPNGKALTYNWNFGDGTSGTGATTTHVYTAPGTFVVVLAVTNSDGIVGVSSTTATLAAAVVTPPNVQPGGPYSGAAGVAVTFNGSQSSDPANLQGGPYALTYTWDFGDGTQGFGATPTHTYSAPGTYTVKLTAQTASGGTASATTSAAIDVAPDTAGNLPTANPGGPYMGTAGTPVAFDGSKSTDPNNATLTFHWDFGDGNSADTGATTTHTYVAGGTYSVRLTVGNTLANNSASTTAKIAAAAAAALMANAGGPYTVSLNQPLQFDGSQTTNPNHRVLTYTWNFGDGSTGDTVKPTHFYTRSGTYTATLLVSDGVGPNGTATAQVTVGGPAAEAVTAKAGGPYQDVTGHAVVFDSSASTDNLNNPLTFSWNFGDGATGSGAMPTHAYSAAGTFQATVTATGAGASSTATATVTISPDVTVMITSPTPNTLFGTNTITVSGTTSSPNANVTVNGITVQASSGSFTVAGVTLREGVNLITATAQDASGGTGTGNVSVILDATPPTISITSPAMGTTTAQSSINVAGLVSDVVTGTIGSNDVSVTVNGVPAQVLNRSYLANGVQLVPGLNQIVVVATDKVNHTGRATTAVQYVPPVQQLSLALVNGDGQTGQIGAVLGQPLVVQLRAADGTPVVNRPITFTVTRSDGQVQMMPTIAQVVMVPTDGQGKASVLFQLGNRVGLGVNQVTATTPGASGPVLFTASSTAAAATQIHAVRGENQRGLLGEALQEAFQVIVTDAHNNPIPGVPVTFTPTMGDGSVSSPSATTDANGKASTLLTLGQQEGKNNYAVQADFAGNTGLPITFAASGFAPGPVSQTSVSGVVLDNANTPIPNATVRLLGTSLSSVSDANGRFQISGAPAGTVTLSVDGSTSTRPETFPFLSFVLNDLPGQNNTLGKPVYLPAIDVDNAQTVGGDDAVTLTMKNVPGVAFTIAPHSVTFPDGTTVGKLSLSQVKSDMVPMEPVNGSAPDLIWTLQPAGTRFSVPVQVTLPNTQALPPGTVTEFYQYDHDLEQFVAIGTMHVSLDGSVMTSDPGFGLTKAGWGHGQPPSTQNNCTVSCDDLNECTADSSYICGCTHQPLTGGSCGNNAKTSTCKASGTCLNGVCIGPNAPDGSSCDDGVFCTKPDLCKSGVCVGQPIPPLKLLGGQSPVALKFEAAFESGLDPLKVFIKTYGFLGDIQPKFSIDLTEQQSCCEAKKIYDSVQDQTTITAGLSVTFGPIFPPNASITVPYVGSVGLYVTISVTGSVAGTWSTDTCDDTSCLKGTAKIEGNVEVGLGGALYNKYLGTYIVTGGANAGINAQVTLGCHNVGTSYGISDTKLIATFTNKNTGRTYSAEKVVFQGVNLGSTNNNFSQF